MTAIYKSKIDWWVPAVVVFTMAIAFIGPIIDGKIFATGIVIAALLGASEITIFASVRYQICGNRLGIRNLLYKWEWYPIDKISEVRKTSGILSAPTLSAKRIAIIFSDKKILKSSMPLEISPIDRDGFIATLRNLNPKITVR